jgi:hypothetical protein
MSEATTEQKRKKEDRPEGMEEEEHMEDRPREERKEEE